MAKRIRIAHIVGNLETGGMQSVVVEIMRKLDRERFDPFLLHFRGPNHFATEIADSGWECHRVGMNRNYKWRHLQRLGTFLRSQNVDIVHTHSHFANFAGRVGAVMGCVPRTIVHYQNTYEHRLDDQFRAMEEFLAPNTDLILACSHGVDEFLKQNFQLGDTPVEILPNAVHLAPFEEARANREEHRQRNDVQDDVFHIVHTARLEPHKHPERLVEALYLSQITEGKSLGNWRASFIGGGSQEDQLRRLIAELDEKAIAQGAEPISPRIRFAGWTKEIESWLAAADVFVLVSENEGLPLSLVEAMAAGAPSVCSDIIGPREVIQDGENGLLIDSHEPANILDAIHKLRHDRSLRERLVEGGISRARDYGMDQFIRRMEAIYEQVACEDASPSRSLPNLLQRQLFLMNFCRVVKDPKKWLQSE